jgi:cytoskeletal protein CcmA (bactofilin family)
MSQPVVNPAVENGLTCVIAEGTKIEGKFTSTENVRLDGQIVGEVNITKKLVMGTTSFIDGNINSQNTAVQGKVKGNLNVSETLQLLGTANVDGQIVAKSFIVDEGAVYNGKLSVSGKK